MDLETYLNTRDCAECGADLHGYHGLAKYCNDCRDSARLARQREFSRKAYAANPVTERTVPCSQCGKMLYRGSGTLPDDKRTCRECRAENRICICEFCAGEFTGRKSGNANRFCSRKCHGASRTIARDPDRPHRSRSERVCEICGAGYRPSRGEQRTCGRACGFELQRRNYKPKEKAVPPPQSRVYFPKCVECDGVFAARNAWAGICSDACRMARKRRSDEAYNALRRPKIQRYCEICLVEVDGLRKWCDDCAVYAEQESKRRAKRRRRALELGAKSEPYTLDEIAKRDDFMCGICGGDVPMTHRVPEHYAPTIDHVIPLAKGGNDTRRNVQLAHFICNSRKGDRG